MHFVKFYEFALGLITIDFRNAMKTNLQITSQEEMCLN